VVQQLFIDFKKAYDSVRRKVLYKILIEFGILGNLKFIKMSLTETYSRVRVGKNVSDRFPIRNGLKQGACDGVGCGGSGDGGCGGCRGGFLVVVGVVLVVVVEVVVVVVVVVVVQVVVFVVGVFWGFF